MENENMNIQKQVQQGFTLIELMIVIAIVGILAAIALPAYQDYTIRAKMSEPMARLAEGKTTIAEAFVTNSAVPAAGLSGLNTTGTDIIGELSYIVNAGDPYIAVSVNASILPNETAEKWFSLSGHTNSDGTITWKCKALDDTRAATDAMPIKWLPANCRG
jgi:type IV pilus assembly protein PilA